MQNGRDDVVMWILPHPASPGAPSKRGPLEECSPEKASLLEGGGPPKAVEGEPGHCPASFTAPP